MTEIYDRKQAEESIPELEDEASKLETEINIIKKDIDEMLDTENLEEAVKLLEDIVEDELYMISAVKAPTQSVV